MNKGIYCLILECITPQKVQIGALGIGEFVPGWYLYVGSALGKNGFSRVSRHIRFYREHYRKPKWHIDYLMMDATFRLRKVICAKTDSDLECVLSSAIGREGVPGFGCSDCNCETHLFYRREMPDAEILTAFGTTGLCGVVHVVDED
jgi:Uri superfamily endonuclease